MVDGGFRRVVILAFFLAPLVDCLLLLGACVCLICSVRVAYVALVAMRRADARAWSNHEPAVQQPEK